MAEQQVEGEYSRERELMKECKRLQKLYKASE